MLVANMVSSYMTLWRISTRHLLGRITKVKKPDFSIDFFKVALSTLLITATGSIIFRWLVPIGKIDKQIFHKYDLYLIHKFSN